MKKVLIIRSANMITIDKLIYYINKKYINQKLQLYVLIQKCSVESFCEKYPDVICIEKEDGSFNYSRFRNNKELTLRFRKLHFNEIYIPSSVVSFSEFDETFLIASSIKTDKHVLFNCNSEIQGINLNTLNVIMNKYFQKLIYMITVFIALILIVLTYIVYYLYSQIKKCIFKRYE